MYVYRTCSIQKYLFNNEINNNTSFDIAEQLQRTKYNHNDILKGQT